ncbi:MAG: hypothetical protein RIT81_29035 [Deltaproteobacteria bacterium]
MSDIRAKPFKAMTDGTYVVDVQMNISITGDKVEISDHSGQGIGDACAALHFAALQSLAGLEITEARNTDRFEDKPDDPGKVVRGEVGLNASKQ